MSDRARGWAMHAALQRRRWLSLTYEERLLWLEQAKRFHAIALGAARGAPTSSRDRPDRSS